jgi:hypothetical protein
LKHICHSLDVPLYTPPRIHLLLYPPLDNSSLFLLCHLNPFIMSLIPKHNTLFLTVPHNITHIIRDRQRTRAAYPHSSHRNRHSATRKFGAHSCAYTTEQSQNMVVWLNAVLGGSVGVEMCRHVVVAGSSSNQVRENA